MDKRDTPTKPPQTFKIQIFKIQIGIITNFNLIKGSSMKNTFKAFAFLIVFFQALCWHRI